MKGARRVFLGQAPTLTSPLVTNIYQSNGACRDSCASEYAFAVVQWQSCWCTNVAPGDTTSVSDCGEDCPGYPSEKCGNRDSGLYGYIALNRSPTSTAGGSRPSPTTPRQVSILFPIACEHSTSKPILGRNPCPSLSSDVRPWQAHLASLEQRP